MPHMYSHTDEADGRVARANDPGFKGQNPSSLWAPPHASAHTLEIPSGARRWAKSASADEGNGVVAFRSPARMARAPFWEKAR